MKQCTDNKLYNHDTELSDHKQISNISCSLKYWYIRSVVHTLLNIKSLWQTPSERHMSESTHTQQFHMLDVGHRDLYGHKENRWESPKVINSHINPWPRRNGHTAECYFWACTIEYISLFWTYTVVIPWYFLMYLRRPWYINMVAINDKYQSTMVA